MRITPRLLAGLTAGAMTLAACSAPASSTGDGSSADRAPEEAQVRVLAAFYPLQYVLTEVGGEDVVVESLTPPGAEAHDLELSPRQVREIGDADAVVVLAGFQAAVDEAVAARAPKHLLDAAELPEIAAHMSEGQEDEDGHAEDDGHGHAEGDPHFWLDPTLLAVLAEATADLLTDADPAGADGYRERADALVGQLTELDETFTSGLESCEQDVIVVMHEAFGFLAERYGLEQVAVAGLDPESEPSPARLREIRETVEDAGVTTIFSESAVDPRVAQTLADDLGIETAVLDPLETQADPESDYRVVMLANLDALRTALSCA